MKSVAAEQVPVLQQLLTAPILQRRVILQPEYMTTDEAAVLIQEVTTRELHAVPQHILFLHVRQVPANPIVVAEHHRVLTVEAVAVQLVVHPVAEDNTNLVDGLTFLIYINK